MFACCSNKLCRLIGQGLNFNNDETLASEKKKIPAIVLAICFAVIAYFAPKLWGNYLDAGILSHFGQPSFLPYRLNAFLAGMFIAKSLLCTPDSKKFIEFKKLTNLLAASICMLPLSKPVIIGFLIFILISHRKIKIISSLLSLKPIRFIGEISYSIYLSHILVIYPVIYFLLKSSKFYEYTSMLRFSIGLIITLPLVLIISHILYRHIEMPCIKVGKIVSKRIEKN